MDKVYMLVENDDGGSQGWGDYVTLVGIYTSKDEANKKLKELESQNDNMEDETDNINPCEHCTFDDCDACGFDDYDHDHDHDYDYDDYDDTKYRYNVYEIPLNETVGKFLGGHAE
ncbi:hypothetical protein [Anaerococcus hydrogenalis]|uniref:hypothetical protein n=1 Tax=Anaerococcus hydrogenalis TaxID=33029 RepID=UPI001D8A5F7F|nr:hypothetical protein [Anaerococcus hydrogenalis]MBS5989590.1 hypothetical protein [Anaerococcus hydrogenalis]